MSHVLLLCTKFVSPILFLVPVMKQLHGFGGAVLFSCLSSEKDELLEAESYALCFQVSALVAV
ncbi:hypothetical protein C4D60_Mb02t14510 [Musa balbisiana]|uniref:Uncharacterized protein n=1 Tax=Musa balbisiana TaxID=52838 RepID=A0A4S8IBJ0_MUSBA|nr:hypothetical protein C4D60_Mb02t14510 [Musa balbisiana]